MKPKKTLITGANGQLGSVLRQKLQEKWVQTMLSRQIYVLILSLVIIESAINAFVKVGKELKVIE